MYLLPFRNQSPDHDFILISKVIKEYLLTGSKRRYTPKTILSSKRFKKIGKLVDSEFLDRKAYRGKWEKLTSRLKEAFRTDVNGYPDLHGGGFIGEVVIKEDKQQDFIRKKSLRFYVSLIGPFFSIHGIDSSTALLSMESGLGNLDKGNFAVTHAITLSPTFEYEDVFKKLENELRAFFPGYLFVPYQIGMSTIKNISVTDNLCDSRTMDTIYEGLFGRPAVHACLTRGDKRYGMNDWIKPLNSKEKSLIDVISQHVIATPTDKTIHKVWKLQESRRPDTLKITGNLLFGVDLFDVIDLTEKSRVIMISAGRGTPSSAKYKIKDSVLLISSNYSFRITNISTETLTMNLIINFKRKDVSVNGEALEIKLIRMKSMMK